MSEHNEGALLVEPKGKGNKRMSAINVVKKPSGQQLEALDIENWPIWEKEISEFSWEYDAQEMCYLLEGKVTVTPENGEPVSFEAGDLVTFRSGLRCIWHIRQPVRKHYQFS